jgi:hypothetical protein
MSAGTVRTFVERVLERHGEEFEAIFPAPFDWHALAADAPAMARRLAAGSAGEEDLLGEEGDLAPELDLVEASEQVFVNAYLGGLAGIALAIDDERDPESILDGLVRPLDDAEEERFEALAGASLGPVERALAGQGDTPDDASAEGAALVLVDTAWPSVEVALESLEPFAPDREAELPHAVRQVLAGLARVAAILAAFRWLAAGRPG